MQRPVISTESAPCPLGDITLFSLTNRSGARVVLSSLGAGIVAISVPDAEGRLANVVLGYKNPADYLADGPCAGKVPGRYANRIAKGRFSLAGKEFSLAVNNGPNALHGGPTGFANRIWQAEVVAPDSVRFTYRSASGEEGYPGCLTASATYRWTDRNVLELRLCASSDAPTVVNLTNHAYFNLDGEASGSVLGHTLRLNASKYLPTDASLIPVGPPADVAGTPMDFTSPKELGRDIKADFPALVFGNGYDNCWVVDRPAGSSPVVVAVLAAAKSGRVLTVRSSQPGVQIYTGNWLEGAPQSISGGAYHDYDGVAIECQGFPDAPNRPDFPSQALLPGELYSHLISFEFSTLK